ncbi:MAG: nicotinate (nicotinamide) nucleotide adenylyltransferase [Verrucomicrobia bacterium]|nr:MAG: nicotinate (nicotinamide) nucleotide adenylyltransferase [Verrucomicrobiota bacterium]
MKQERIGLFGGTFDPVHLGHLILAYDALELLHLDQLIFLPARLSPYKKEAPPQASREDRLAMLLLATEGEPRFTVDPRELSRRGPSYAIETVKELEKEFPEATFFYLLGEDHANTLPGWREIEELKKRVTFSFFIRGSSSTSRIPLLKRRIDISSTEIRDRCARGTEFSYLLSPPVFSYLEKKSLYRPSSL